MTIALDALFRHFNIASLGGKRRQRKAKCIGAVFLDDRQRIDDVARGFTHFFPGFITDKRMDINVLKGDVFHELNAHHHHAGNPEEKDVKCGHQHRRGIKGFQ